METEKVKHIRNYAKVRKMILAHYDKWLKDTEKDLARAKDCLERIRRGEKVKWDPNDWHEMTEKTCVNLVSQFESFLRPPCRGKPRKDSVLWYRQKALDRLDAADRAPKFTGLKVDVEWRKSHTWGNVPTAECRVFGDGPAIYTAKDDKGKPLADHNGLIMISTHYGVGHASGAGYDKLSAAVEEGIMCPTIDRLVIEHEKTWRLYAVDGKDYFPHLSIGGKGVGVLRDLFNRFVDKPPIPGFKWIWEAGKTWDFIEVRPKAKRK